MTVIAWDGTTLAADKRAQNCSHAYCVTKIFDCGEYLVGVAGHLARGIAMMRWLRDGADPEKFPAEKDDDWATLLVVHRSGQIERYESRAEPFTVEATYHAVGSARDFALMALHLGIDARTAVALTCELTSDCGNGIDELSFEVAMPLPAPAPQPQPVM